ncbi:hypothetical protein HMPREF3216_00662 [Gardnerella vaginalis]|uniref:Uncharacterized protein n=1 Tax=Gardnerella vaginalis TaxID=2702 RepID=A0A133NPQ9_GARVA|nr:hypothetical protein HMPREF3216_00662 [Gardnerella vaginalis]
MGTNAGKREQTWGSVLVFVSKMGRNGNKRGEVCPSLFTKWAKMGTNAGKREQTWVRLTYLVCRKARSLRKVEWGSVKFLRNARKNA